MGRRTLGDIFDQLGNAVRVTYLQEGPRLIECTFSNVIKSKVVGV